MSKKNAILVLGAVLLCLGWSLTLSKIKEQQELNLTQDFPVKKELFKNKWERLSDLELVNGELNGPMSFYVKLTGLGLNISDVLLNEINEEFNYNRVKMALIDSGIEEGFFTYKDEDSKDMYLVRVDRKGEETQLMGFYLDATLNFLSAGLENEPWFLLNENNMVLAASEISYVGSTYKFGQEALKTFIKVNGQKFQFGSYSMGAVSLAWINVLGVLGIILLASSLLVYSNGEGELEEKDLGAVVPSNQKTTAGTKSNEFELNVFDEIEDDVEMMQIEKFKESPHPSKAKRGQKPLADKVPPVPVASSSEQNRSSLNYTEFLIENPMLNSQNSIEPQRVETVEKKKENLAVEEPEQVKKVEEVDPAEEWVKLAEELSDSIDKFTKEMQKDLNS